jgi:CRP-like cAMP-binding protein
MVELLRAAPSVAQRFLAHMLARNIRVEEDVVDQLFNSSEKRLARVLLLLARYGRQDWPLRIPQISQETLAEMAGLTRSRVNFFMNNFRDLGFIDYHGDIIVHGSLLTVVLHE